MLNPKHFLLRWFAVLAAAAVGLIPGAKPLIAQSDIVVEDEDDRAWFEALRAGNASAFQDYLDAHPLGRHTSEAFARMIALSRVPTTGDIWLVEPAAGAAAQAQSAATVAGDLY